MAQAGAAITWLGHATVTLELDGLGLITDPVLRDRVGPLVRIADSVAQGSSDGIDGVLLSHLHADHADPASLRALAGAATVLAPLGAGGWLRGRGVGDVRELAPGERTTLDRLSISATPAVHPATRRPLGGPRASPIGYLIEGSVSAYFAGDTDLFEQMAELRGIDVALLPIWGWGSSVGEGHLDPERAARAAAIIAPRIAIPIHWGTFALPRPARRTTDPRRPAEEFAALTERYAPDVEVVVLEPGERLVVATRRPQPPAA
jgi:L-ascorbate metabolism protein UlaG (beta-lactamase superfamily)